MHIKCKTLIHFIKPAIWLLVITVFCLMPVEDLPKIRGYQLPFFDKVVHFGMYTIFAILMVSPLKISRLPVWPVTFLTSLFVGGAIEILQYAVTNYRSASWGDFSADFAGAFAGLIIYDILVAGKRWERFI